MTPLNDRVTSTTIRPRQDVFLLVQTALLVSVAFVSVIASQSSSDEVFQTTVTLGLVLFGITGAGALLQARRADQRWLFLVVVLDVGVVAVLRECVYLDQPRTGLIVLIPVLYLSYRFGTVGTATAILSTWFVAVFPFLTNLNWPESTAQWGTELLSPAIITIVALVVRVAALRSLAQRVDLVEAYENLRLSVARGDHSAEALRISVAEGLDGAEKLRVSVADGLDGAEALRVSVADGLDGAEELRLSQALNVEGAEKLRVSVAEGVDSAEALRLSVAEGVDSAEALRVSVADGLDGAEALRVSVAQGVDAASTALAVVDTVDAGITFYDSHGVVMLTNDTARALAASAGGSSATPAQGLHVFEDDRSTPIAAVDQIFGRAARGELVTRKTYWVGTGEEQRAIMGTSQYVRRASGELIGTVVATHDVTPLVEAIRSRDEFLTTVSHELRTPLTSVIGYLELIEDTLDIAVAGIAHEFGIIQRNSQRLLGLINDLLTTAEGQASLERRPFDLSELAENSLHTIAAAATTAGITIAPPNFVPVVAEVDANRIGDVIDKLLSNAVKFTPRGGEITVTVHSLGSDAVVTVTDTGIGISTSDQEHIFERFFRSSTARSGAVAGTGLGLSTAKIIVDAHHGTIRAVSTIDVGTSVIVRLPLVVSRTSPQ